MFKVRAKQKKGFSLVELLISISIFVILTGIIIFNQNSFDNNIFLNNLAYDIAFTIRQAQTYGVNVKEFASSTVSIFPYGYGIYFNTSFFSGGNNKNFILFADADNNHTLSSGSVTYCPSGDAECIQKYTISRGNFISLMCAGTDSACVSASELAILFNRPSPEALIYADDSSTPSNFARITVATPNNVTKVIEINKSGLIFVH